MKSKLIKTGNAGIVGKDRRGWFMGSFFNEGEHNHQKEIELKWGIHPKGELRESKAPDGDASTVSLLIEGKYAIDFGDEKIVLENRGDYLLFQPNMPHKCEALEDSIILTVRWPSL